MHSKTAAELTKILIMLFILLVLQAGKAQAAEDGQYSGTGSILEQMEQWGKQNPEMKYLLPSSLGGSDDRDEQNNQKQVEVDPGKWPGGPFLTRWPDTLKSASKFKTTSVEAGLLNEFAKENPTNGDTTSNTQQAQQTATAAHHMAKTVQMPGNAAKAAQASQQAQGMAAGNAMGDVAKNQAASAIDYCGKFMKNFTSEDGNKWNKVRDQLFVPIGILLLLPGAVLTQVKAIVSAGNPVLAESNPFEGILRSFIALFLIPASYLIVNWGIDLSNSITYTIASEYERIFGNSMYKDALCAEIKAFPTRGPQSNQNTGVGKNWPSGEVKSQADFEKFFLENKKEDPCSKVDEPMSDKTDEGMPAGAMAARAVSFSGNAGLTGTWNILCAFQMAYLFYLFFVGPVVAGLWVWPIKNFREAFPNWVEGVVTICFWSLFWNTTILLIACFKGVDESGTIIVSALNFLATSSVKYAFDFAGLIKAAGAEATKKAQEGANKGGGGKGGGQGGHGGGHSAHHGSHGSHGSHGAHGVHGQHGQHGVGVGGGSSGGGFGGGGVMPTFAGSTADGAGAETETHAELAGGLGLAALSHRDAGPVTRLDLGHIPLPPGVHGNAHNGMVSHYPGQNTFQLGDYSLERGQGEDTLRDSHGNVVGTLNPASVPYGDHYRMNFEGGSLSYQTSANSELFTLSDGKHTEQLAFNHTNPNAEMHPVSHNGQQHIALPTASGDSLFLSSDGNNLSYMNNDGSITNLDLSSTGQVQLSDGSMVSASPATNGSDISVFNAAHQQSDAFSVIHNPNGSISIGHADGANHPQGMINFTAVANNGISSASYDDSGRLYQKDTVNGDMARTEYYDPASAQSLLGASETHYNDNDDYTTNYFDANNALVASSQFQNLPNGGSLELLRDAQNNLVSSQQQFPNADGGASMNSTHYGPGGDITSSTFSSYDQNGNLISTSNDLSRGSVWSDASGVHPDGGIFSSTVVAGDAVHVPSAQIPTNSFDSVANNYSTPFTSARVDVVPPIVFDPTTVNQNSMNNGSESYSRQSSDAQSGDRFETRSVQALPVDIAGSQITGPETQFSNVAGTYAQSGEAQQGNTSDVAYFSPVTTSSVDVVPPSTNYSSVPEQYGKDGVDNQNPLLSLEQTLHAQTGDLNASTFELGNSVYAGTNAPAMTEAKPTADYTHSAVPAESSAHARSAIAGEATSQRVMPVDIAGTQVTSSENQFSNVAGTYAQSGDAQQGKTADVAYFSPVTTTSVDVVPPATSYSAPAAEHYGKDTVDTQNPFLSLEQTLHAQSGDLNASTFELGNSVYAAPTAAPSFESNFAASSASHPVSQTADTNGDASESQRVIPVDIAGTQVTGPETQFSNVAGSYAQAGEAQQGKTADVAYFSPVTTTSVDVVPPAVAYSASAVEQYARTETGSTLIGYEPDVTRAPLPAMSDDSAAPRAVRVEESALTAALPVAESNLMRAVPLNPAQHVLASDIAASQVYQETSYQPQHASNASNSIKSTGPDAFGSQQPKDGARNLMAIFSDLDPNKRKQSSSGSPQNASQQGSGNSAGDKKEEQKVGSQLSRFLPSAHNADNCDNPTRLTESLERQMLDAGARVQPLLGSALGAALGRANSASIGTKRPDEYLNNALMDYHSIHALLSAGKIQEAEQVSKYALQNLAKCQTSDPKFQTLTHAFVVLFQRKNMTAQVTEFDGLRVMHEKSVTNTQPVIAWSSEL